MPREDQVHVSLYIHKDQMKDIQFLLSSHKDTTGFDLSISAAIRTLIADGLLYRKIKKNEYSPSSQSSRKIHS